MSVRPPLKTSVFPVENNSKPMYSGRFRWKQAGFPAMDALIYSVPPPVQEIIPSGAYRSQAAKRPSAVNA